MGGEVRFQIFLRRLLCMKAGNIRELAQSAGSQTVEQSEDRSRCEPGALPRARLPKRMTFSASPLAAKRSTTSSIGIFAVIASAFTLALFYPQLALLSP